MPVLGTLDEKLTVCIKRRILLINSPQQRVSPKVAWLSGQAKLREAITALSCRRSAFSVRGQTMFKPKFNKEPNTQAINFFNLSTILLILPYVLSLLSP